MSLFSCRINNVPYGFQGYVYGLASNKDASRYAVCVQIPGAAQDLVIPNSSFEEISQNGLTARFTTIAAHQKCPRSPEGILK